ncbi:hypothetical protein ANAPH1_00330 [Anaplasma phagocytophilum]|nr:hypothetical protein ANAPH1_00330 [Anaplasma phagocytophilum]SCV66097.1 hypothetical protein ANAPH2_01480 [Anaplasma phagocytophilum]
MVAVFSFVSSGHVFCNGGRPLCCNGGQVWFLAFVFFFSLAGITLFFYKTLHSREDSCCLYTLEVCVSPCRVVRGVMLRYSVSILFILG